MRLESSGLFAITFNMSFRDFIASRLFGPIMTRLVCMPFYRPYLEDLSDIDSYDLSNATSIRIPVCNETPVFEPVITFVVWQSKHNDLYSNGIILCIVFESVNEKENVCWTKSFRIPLYWIWLTTAIPIKRIFRFLFLQSCNVFAHKRHCVRICLGII